MATLTVNKNTSIKDRFVESFQQYQTQLNGHRDHPLAKFRQAGFEEFQEMDFPTTRDEDWKYTSVQRMLRQEFKSAKATDLQLADIEQFTYPNLNAIRLVFVNGIYNEALSSDRKALPGGLMIHLMEEALENEEYRAWIEDQIAYKGGTAKNIFLPMNRAFSQSGIFIKTVRGIAIEQPIHLLHVATDGDHIAYPQLFVWASESSQLSIIESYNSTTDQAYFNNSANHWQVEANAHVHYYRTQQEGGEAFKIHNTLVMQGRDSVFSSYVADLGGKMVRNNMSVELTGSNTETNMYGVYLGHEQQHIDNQTFMDHALPHCVSNELYKGILTDRARGVFNGKVLVRQDAQKTNAFQQNASMVLSDKAVMDAKPQLEIYADDVRCSHGATIGQMDEGSVFYLRSRGIPEAKAKNLLQRAFVGEAVEAMPLEVVQERVMAAIEEKLG
ncbi:MAG: Fe-S cluster assembly protein SufD [Bacteroidota bacterium]